ncbi:MAG TPA: PQQ-binding-like beta-propeller repeat protein [Bryobacteraceae bacterium]|nr:PQQ-binding-like beta-propeller repeat protein [Bryobacteraceae bacterium]
MRFFLCLASFTLAVAADWPQYRGPNSLGLTDDRNLPVEMGPEKNVVWRAAVPPGHSSPILIGPRIFLTAVDLEALFTIALDRATGRQLWKQECPRPRKEPYNKTNSPASGTPASDGKIVVSFFGDYGLQAYTVEGKPLWQLPLGPFNNLNGHGSSPVIIDDLVLLICDQDTGSYYIAVDKNTGKVRYKVERPETTRGYATPTVWRPENGPAELIVPGAYVTTAYELHTGKKLWWAGGMAWQLKGAAVVVGDRMYLNSWEAGGDTETAPDVEDWAAVSAKFDRDGDGRLSVEEASGAGLRNAAAVSNYDLNKDNFLDERDWTFLKLHRQAQNSVLSIQLGGRGDVTKTHVRWRYRKSLPNCSTPLVYKDALWMVKDGGVLTTLNPENGAVIKQGRIVGALEPYWASPIGADGKVYVVSQAGKLAVLKAQGEWEILKVNDLADEVFATPALGDGRLYVRTLSTLYAFGLPKQ